MISNPYSNHSNAFERKCNKLKNIGISAIFWSIGKEVYGPTYVHTYVSKYTHTYTILLEPIYSTIHDRHWASVRKITSVQPPCIVGNSVSISSQAVVRIVVWSLIISKIIIFIHKHWMSRSSGYEPCFIFMRSKVQIYTRILRYFAVCLIFSGQIPSEYINLGYDYFVHVFSNWLLTILPTSGRYAAWASDRIIKYLVST